VLLTGWGGLQGKDLGDDVLIVDEIPHEWLFPRMAAVVHHGGAGTTGTALQSGVPSVVVPSFADQFFWGEQVARLGVGVSLPRQRLSVASLAESITTTAEARIRSRATALGVELRAENGVERAVERLHSILGA
jgi:UDP:flavonoid glycosyltransferase YjiC (YdhE family)